MKKSRCSYLLIEYKVVSVSNTENSQQSKAILLEESMAAKIVGLPVGIFLLYGVMLLGANLGFASAKVCPFICFGNADYMVCKSSGDKKLPPSCNCCLAGPGCTIYYKNGTSRVCS